MARIISGKELSLSIKEKMKEEILYYKRVYERLPHLVVVLVGDDPASKSYVKGKEQASLEIGIENTTICLPDDITEESLLAKIDELNNDDNVDGILSAVKDFEAVNFDYGDNLFTFCRKFEYDWKRDLPDIARLIDMKYPEGCEIILTYREWFEAGVICDKKIFAKTLLKEKLRSRRLAIMLIDFMKDESVRLSKINSTKNPDTRLLFDDLPSVADDVKRTFYLIIDIDETIRSERDIVDYCIYGGWINKEFVEVLGKEEVLPIFEDLIPDILRREMILCG